MVHIPYNNRDNSPTERAPISTTVSVGLSPENHVHTNFSFVKYFKRTITSLKSTDQNVETICESSFGN